LRAAAWRRGNPESHDGHSSRALDRHGDKRRLAMTMTGRASASLRGRFAEAIQSHTTHARRVALDRHAAKRRLAMTGVSVCD
jgi:hypothetical protein